MLGEPAGAGDAPGVWVTMGRPAGAGDAPGMG